MKTQIRIYETQCVDGNAPECPKCGHWNALLDERDFAAGKVKFICRDCNFSVLGENLRIVMKKLDRPGMGNLSTYSKTGVVIRGDEF